MNYPNNAFEISLSQVLLLVGVAAVGLIFGLLYDRRVDDWQSRGGGEYTAIWVAMGCAVTIGFSVVMMWIVFGLAIAIVAGVMMLIAFITTGLPMLLGAMRRHSLRLSDEAEKLKRQAESALDYDGETDGDTGQAEG